MTETTILDERAVEEIEVRANAATEGPWAVWDSNSWRRIGTADPFRDGNVLCPITQRDGHPDLAATREDLEFVAHAREDIPALCATVKHLRALLTEISEADDHDLKCASVFDPSKGLPCDCVLSRVREAIK